MFACLYSVSSPLASLVKLAEDFTPRFEVIGPLVMLDISGLSRLIGSPREIGEQLRRAAEGPVRIAVAPTQTAAALLALGRAGLTVVLADEQVGTLAALPVSLLGELDRLRLSPANASPPVASPPPPAAKTDPPHIGAMWDALPYFESTLDRTSEIAVKAHCGSGCGGGGWKHPRDSHAASTTRRPPRAVPMSQGTEHPHAAPSIPLRTPDSTLRTPHSGLRTADSALRTSRVALADIQKLLETLRRWGVKTFAALAVLPPGEVYERLGARGVFWQRVARGEDATPLVPWVPEEPFDAVLDLEWPIEGLEPLSFVLGRLLEPLAERLERADRGAAVLYTHLRLVSKDVHARTLQLPAPMRDPKTLRTLILLDLESNPPSAAIDRVRLLLEPTPARVLQWQLFERAQASPEQVSTLLARLTALMGETHVGSPRLVDSWKPGAFAMQAFEVQDAKALHEGRGGHEGHEGMRAAAPATALRRFRLPVPVRVQVQDGRPVRVTTDRRGVAGGPIVQAAGPWRTSGEWWNDGIHVPRVPNGPRVPDVHSAPAAPHLSTAPVAPAHSGTAPHQSHSTHPSHLTHPPPLAHDISASYGETSPKRPLAAKAGPSCWDRDEWDIAVADGIVYRLYVERDVGQWFLEGVVD